MTKAETIAVIIILLYLHNIHMGIMLYSFGS